MYLILGCGDVGFTVASKLKERGTELAIVEQNLSKVDQLKKMGYNAFVGDFGDPQVLINAGIERADAVMVLAPGFPTVERALGAINQLKFERGIDPVVLVRISDEAETNDVKKLGASDVIPASQILANSALEKFQELEIMTKEKRLRKLLKGLSGKMAIVLQTNPDPDAIASGIALKRYARWLGIDADIIYDGQIGREQNRALVNLFNLQLLTADKVKFEDYGIFALVDVATHANCCLPQTITPTIVIDHHSVPSGEVKAVYQDITIVGATATILTNYLRYAGIEFDKPLATALIFGILTDTMNFARGTTELDLNVFRYLRNFFDPEQLAQLQSPPISPETLDVLSRAIRSSRVKGGYLISNVGEVKDRDTIPHAADFLLKREGVMTVLVYGIHEGNVRVSARTNDLRVHLGRLLQSAFGDMGSAGGHASMAGATIPLRVFGRQSSKKALRGVIDRAVGKRFLEVVGIVKPKK